jgi:hypothetical protein
MTLTGWSFWSRHRHITRVPTSRGSWAAHDAGAAEDLSLLSTPPPFDAAPAPLPAPPAAAEPFSGAVDASIEPIRRRSRSGSDVTVSDSGLGLLGCMGPLGFVSVLEKFRSGTRYDLWDPRVRSSDCWDRVVWANLRHVRAQFNWLISYSYRCPNRAGHYWARLVRYGELSGRLGTI